MWPRSYAFLLAPSRVEFTRSDASSAWFWPRYTEMNNHPQDITHIARCADCQARASLDAPDVDLERVWSGVTAQLSGRAPDTTTLVQFPNGASASAPMDPELLPLSRRHAETPSADSRYGPISRLLIGIPPRRRTLLILAAAA